MHNFLRGTLALLITLALCPTLLLAEPATPSTPLKVALIVPLSGDAATWGINIRNGAELALKDLPPERSSRLELIYEDDGLSSPRSVAAYQKLKSQNRIDVLINASSGTANALAPLTERDHIPFIALASDKQVVSGRQYANLLWVTPEEEARVLIAELKRRGIEHLARICTTHVGTLAVKDAFDAQWRGQAPIPDESYPMEINSFQNFMAKLRLRKDNQAVIVILFPGQLGTFARQVRQFQIPTMLVGVETFEDPESVK